MLATIVTSLALGGLVSDAIKDAMLTAKDQLPLKEAHGRALGGIPSCNEKNFGDQFYECAMDMDELCPGESTYDIKGEFELATSADSDDTKKYDCTEGFSWTWGFSYTAEECPSGDEKDIWKCDKKAEFEYWTSASTKVTMKPCDMGYDLKDDKIEWADSYAINRAIQTGCCSDGASYCPALPIGGVAGLAVGCFVLTVAFVLVVYFFFCKKKKEAAAEAAAPQSV